LKAADPVRIFISAGERSGDVHAANLIRAVRSRHPEIEFEGFGGPRMVEAGCQLHRDMLDLSVMGVSFLGHLSQFIRLLRFFYWRIRERRFAALVLVDFPGFHFVLARLARARRIPVVYYICPQIWGWAPWRQKKVLRLTDLLMVILPFEVELYRGGRTPVVYVGHPLADELFALPPEEGDEVRRSLALPPGGRTVGVFPGSRGHEVRDLMPLLRGILDGMGLDAARHRVLVSCCRPEFRPVIEEALRGLGPPVIVEERDSRALMAACDFALVASGTATLELAFYQKPMVVLYRVSDFALRFYRTVSITPFISLVNILGKGEVVPERIVSRAEPGDLPARARALFLDTPEREACLAGLARLRQEAFQTGANERAARALVEFLRLRSSEGSTR